MAPGIGGSTTEKELSKMSSSRENAIAISVKEYAMRLQRVRELMAISDIDALYLDASTSLRYFTGLQCHASERLHGAIITVSGELIYVVPAFEEQKSRTEIVVDGDFMLWDEHDDPADLVINTVLKCLEGVSGTLAIDDQTPFFIASGLQKASSNIRVVDGGSLISKCRCIKSSNELTLLSQAKMITLQIHQAAASILYEGLDTREVQEFLDAAHIACGMDGRSTFKIVLFGEPTAYPHGVPHPQTLCEGDMVLIDTGATLHGYNSDITRSYVFGEPDNRQREIWDLEKSAQAAAFAAAENGVSCSVLDRAARNIAEAAGFGPDYQVPGIPHRTGHGVGLDVHEHPYIVRGNELPLAPGMCFSIEPMICCYGEFGVRLEDHAYMTKDGACWFTEPSESIDNPFNL